MRRGAGVRMVIFLGVLLLCVMGASAWGSQREVSHDPVNTYTDGLPIEAGNTVSYSVFAQDNVTKTTTQIADHDTATVHTFSDAGFVKGRAYNFTAQTHLLSGTSSEMSPEYTWLFPKGKASPVRAPGGWVVGPPK